MTKAWGCQPIYR